MNKSLIDTDIFSEIFKAKNPKVTEKADLYYKKFKQYSISCFTLIELLKGCYKDGNKKRERKIQSCLKDWEILDFDKKSWKIAAHIFGELEKAGKVIGNFDVFIASIAIRRRLTLVTGNTKHYQRIQKLGYSLKLENWRE